MTDSSRMERASFIRIMQLERVPITGTFDLSHLLQIHAYIFQDSPDAMPGRMRPPTDSWVKCRALDSGVRYQVPYFCADDGARHIAAVLQTLQSDVMHADTPDRFAAFLAHHYARLDYLHPFVEGNSRTLRTFTRQWAHSVGYCLDWQLDRDALYRARDREVLRLAYPGLSRERADALPDTPEVREEYEAYWFGLRLIEQGPSLADLVRSTLSPLNKPTLRVVR